MAVVERGPLKGRDQEWNLSQKELNELTEQGLLSSSEAKECVTSTFNPVRAGFCGGADVWTQDVLNIGVRPDRIIEKVLRLELTTAIQYAFFNYTLHICIFS